MKETLTLLVNFYDIIVFQTCTFVLSVEKRIENSK